MKVDKHMFKENSYKIRYMGCRQLEKAIFIKLKHIKYNNSNKERIVYRSKLHTIIANNLVFSG